MLRFRQSWPILLAAVALAACQVAGPLAGTQPTPLTGTTAPTATPLPQVTATPTPALDPEAPAPEPPPAILIIDGQQQTAGVGTYCWSEPSPQGAPGLCVDMIGIPTAFDPLMVAPGSFTARFDLPLDQAPSELVLNVIPAEDELEVAAPGGRWWGFQQPVTTRSLDLSSQPETELQLEPGLYVLNLFVRWDERGDVSYGFLVQVGEPGDSGAGAFTLPASCQPANANLSPYVDPGGRYCLLFPAHFRIGAVTLDGATFFGPPLDQSVEPVFAALAVEVAGPAEGRSLTEVVDEYLQANAQGLAVMREAATLGGAPAEVLKDVPGRFLSWQAFVVHNDTVYHLALFPMDPALLQAQPDAQAVWQAVTESFTFLTG